MAQHSGGHERRRNPRVQPAEGVKARLTSGETAIVIDVSVDGAALEIACPLAPGTPTSVIIGAGDDRLVLRGRVTRCRMKNATPGPSRRFIAGFHVDVQALSDHTRERLEELLLDLQLTARDDLPEVRRAVISVDVNG